MKPRNPTPQTGVSFQELPDAAGFLDREVELLFRLGGEVPTTSPQSGTNSPVFIALICTTRRRTLPSASRNQGPEKGDLIPLPRGGGLLCRPTLNRGNLFFFCFLAMRITTQMRFTSNIKAFV